jgi:TRAP-type C4-dicarboxylate transport system permease small subunit
MSNGPDPVSRFLQGYSAMNFYEITVRRISRYMYYVAGGAIVLMMLLTCADVLLRLVVTLYAKSGWPLLAGIQPIPGTYELVCFLGASAASFAMAHTTLESGHVAVNFIVRLLSEKLQAGFKIVTGSLSCILFALIAWHSVVYARALAESGEVSMTLQLPYYPFVYGVAFASFAVCLVLTMTIINEWMKVFAK